jgi:ATP-dependent Clp protease protease subunit
MANAQPCETHEDSFISSGLKKVLAGVLLAAFSTVAVPAPKEIMADPAAHELFDLRTVRLMGEINEQTAADVNRQLQLLDDISSEPITMIVNSPGGSVTDGFAIIDKMHDLKSKVKTVCEGGAASMAAIIMTQGDKGMRTSTPSCQFMFHQLSAGLQGKGSDILANAAEIKRLRDRMNDVLAEASGMSSKEIEEMIEVDHFMTPKEALRFHFIDSVTYPKGKIEDAASVKDQMKGFGMPFSPFGMNNVTP